MNENAKNANVTCKGPAIHGMGLFATELISSGGRVIEYAGAKIGSEEMLRRCAAGNFFIFALQNGKYIDGSVDYNLARFINHSCEPNCQIEREEDAFGLLRSGTSPRTRRSLSITAMILKITAVTRAIAARLNA